MANGKQQKKTRLRSPNYPAIALPDAVEKARRIYNQDGRAGSPMAIALQLIGFSKLHGQSAAVISAMRKFGLVEDKGGKVIPSQTAIDIIEFPEDHARHVAAVQKAVLSPAIYSELIEQYRAIGELPSDGSLKPELIADKAFNPNSVNEFLIDFRRSLEYAGLLKENKLVLPSQPISGEENEKPPVKELAIPVDQKPKEPLRNESEPNETQGKTYKKSTDQTLSIHLPLPRSNFIEIRVLAKLSRKELADFKKVFDVMAELSLVEEANDSSDQSGK